MSADLYTSEIDSEKYGDLFLEMKVGGNLRIVSIDPGSEGSSCFTLPPTTEGWKEAENLIGALQEWVRHTKELEEQKIWAEGFTKGLITPHSVKLIDLPDNPTINIEEDSTNNRRQAFVEWMTRGNMEHRNKAKEHPLDCGWWKDWHNCSCGVFDK